MITNASWSLEDGSDRVCALFRDTFGAEPQAVHSAPGRVNLIGEHTDYNGGYALPIALPHRTFVAVSRRDDRVVRLVSAQSDGVREVNLDEVGPHDSDRRVEGWPAYVVGVAWALEQSGCCPFPGIDLAVDSCVPFGAGLSSSAALECAVAVAWDAMCERHGGRADTDEGRAELVAACVQAENQVAGAPTGGMDQAASLRCREGFALMLDCRDQSVRHVPFDMEAVGVTLLVVDTRAPHALVDGQYAQRRATCDSAAHKLGVELLVDVPGGSDLSVLTGVERARVEHVMGEIERTQDFVRLLESGELTSTHLHALGDLMVASHRSLRDLYEVTCPELDTVVDVAVARGAYGARMTGGGFGGSAIALVDRDQVDQVATAIEQAFAERGFNQPHFLRAYPASPAR